jgi:hypothetical protein
VQHGLAVKADDIDILAGDAVLRVEGGDRLGMGQSDGAFGLAQDAGPRIALRQVDGFGQGLAQQATFPVGVGPVAGRADRLHPPAVGFDQGDVDPVERGAAHQTECRQHHCHVVTPCPRRPAGVKPCVKPAHLIMPQRAGLRQPIPTGFRNPVKIP